jgi:hypothetical protein
MVGSAVGLHPRARSEVELGNTVAGSGLLAPNQQCGLYICPDRLVSHRTGIIAALNDLYGCCLA